MSIRGRLESEFLPFVIKPGRYAGGELGQIVKDPDNRVSYLHAYPDKYELGQSHFGLQILYHVVNRDDRFLCERAFAPDTDAEQLMREKNIPLFSLESGRPAAEFDVIGFNLVDETVYTNLVAMLDLAGLPLRSKDRTDEHPLVFAGGSAVYNPEPVAPFVDLFFIGDAEEGLPEMLEVIHELKDASRAEKLEALCKKVKSVYVPAFYDDQHQPTVDFAPEAIEARIVPELKLENYPEQPLVPMVEITQDHLSVEIMRGCPQGCRFCMAGPIYRPVRARSKNDIMRQVETQLDRTGHDEISLLSLSSSDHPEIDSLAVTLARRLEPRKISVALPSLRPGTISPALLDAVRRVRRYGLTIAPEAGTERLRLFLRKKFPDQAIYDTARLAFEKGWSTIKLYFMVGLPSETEQDLDGIVNIISKIHAIGREYPGRKTINVTLSPFVPKPHTPFQWDQGEPEEATYRKIARVKSSLRLGGVNVKHNSTQLAQMVCVLGRGDRRMADTIELAYRSGCRFDGWGESFSHEKWLEAFSEAGVDIPSALSAIPFSNDLPWSHIRKGVSVEHLQKERNRTSAQLGEYTPPKFGDDETSDQPQLEFGRGRKKVASRNTVVPTKNRVRVRWGKSERYRYMSHLDNIRMVERALRRARVPVSFSQGFNPTIKHSFGPPLPLGFTSEAEYVDITLDTTLLPHMIEDLKRAMPEGVDVFEARAVLGKSPSLSATLNRVVYRLPLSLWNDRAQLQEQVEHLIARKEIIVKRTKKNAIKEIDIRTAIYDITVGDDYIELVLGLGEGGYTRPPEVIGFLTDGLSMDVIALPFHRRAMYRQDEDGNKIDAMDL